MDEFAGRLRVSAAGAGDAGCEPYSDSEFSEPAEVHANPFVIDGLGAPKGLHPFEHVQWAQTIANPLSLETVSLESDLEAATQWVTAASAEEVDDFRRDGLRSLLAVAASLEKYRDAWARRAPLSSSRWLRDCMGLCLYICVV